MSDKKKDLVNNPPHYNMGKFEVIDVIEDWKFGYHLGNVVKYVARAEYKGERLQDLNKALWYLQRYIDQFESEDFGITPRHNAVLRFDIDDVIEDWKLGFRLGNVVDHLFRAWHEGDCLHNLCEALRHLKRYVQKLESVEPPTEFQVTIPKKKLLKG
jgi:hypothetical protein